MINSRKGKKKIKQKETTEVKEELDDSLPSTDFNDRYKKLPSKKKKKKKNAYMRMCTCSGTHTRKQDEQISCCAYQSMLLMPKY